VFLGSPLNQTLSDPQSLNAYSYSDDNPITKSDPTGKQFCEAACLDDIAIALAIQAGRGYLVNLGIGLVMASNANSVPSNISQPAQVNTNSTITVSPTLSVPLTAQDYANIAEEQILPSVFAPVGGETSEFVFGPGKKLIGSAAGIGVSSLLQGEAQRGSTGQSQSQIFVNAGINAAASYGANQIVGSVPGRDVQGINANFFTGAHMQNEIQNGVVSQGLVSTVGHPVQNSVSSVLSQLSGALSALSSLLSVHSAK